MNKKSLFFLITSSIILVLGPLFYFRFVKPNKSSAAWFNDTWTYRKSITFNNSGSSVSNQKVKLDINTATAVDPNTVNFNTADLTFIPNIAKRNAGTGSSSPFAVGVIIEGNLSTSTTSDTMTFSRGNTINGSFYDNWDNNQGSIVFWITPEWNGNDNLIHQIAGGGNYMASIFKYSDNKLVFQYEGTFWQLVSVDVSSWVAGKTYNIVISWDSKNKIDGTNYVRISINDSHTFGGTALSTNLIVATTQYIGSNFVSTNPANALIEGLTIYRRPLWDGNNGINVGNGDEISQIFNSGVGQDPTLITGSWDVVFALPTNASTGSLGVGGTGNAWSHPHSSNVLYTSTTNTGGFMMAGTAPSDGWTDRLNGGGAISVNPLSASVKIYGGGYSVQSDGATTSQGIGRTATGQTIGQNYVVRAIANSDGTSIPKVQIWDNTNNAEITSLTGTIGSGRTAPDVLLFTFELPTVARNGVASDCTSIDVRLLNTQSSGTVYWHQVELLANLIDNPSLDVGSSATGIYIPSGWANQESGYGIDAEDASKEDVVVHSGSSSVKINTTTKGEGYQIGSILSTGTFYSAGGSFYGDGVAPFYLTSYLNNQAVPQNTLAGGGVNTKTTSAWTNNFGILRVVSMNRPPWWSTTNTQAVGSRYMDDIYQFLLTPVSLTITPASLANSTESTGIRIDGMDSGTAPISNLTTTAGTIKFNYTPRHSAADSNKFTQSGTVTDDVYLGEWYGDSDDYIKLYWDSANTLMLKYSMNGVGNSATYNATGGITAGTTYAIKVDYTGGSTMNLSIGNTANAITLSSIPAVFGTKPSIAYWGTNSSSTGQADATFAQTSITTGIKMKSNCDDIRFTDQNGNILDYYYDSTNGICNAESTDFYVLMPSINGGQNSVFMYYGNTSASKGSKNTNFSQSTFSQSSTTIATSEEQSKAPVAYWAMDEGQGSTLNNESGIMNNGTLGSGTSAPSWQTEDMCVSGKCLKFDGVNDNVDIGNSAGNLEPTTAVSVSAWVKRTGSLANFSGIVSSRKNSGNDGGYIIVGTSTNTIRFYILKNASAGNWAYAETNNALPSNEWHFITGIWNGTTVKIYVNGVQQSTTGSSTTIYYFPSPTQNHFIGKYGNNSSGYWPGFLDEVKIYPYARSASEIKADFNARGTQKGVAANVGARRDAPAVAGQPSSLSNGLVGYWNFDNGSGTTAPDLSGNSNTATLGAGTSAPSWASGKFGNSLNFDGTDYTQVTDSDSLTTSSGFTWSSWVYLTKSNWPTFEEWATIFSKDQYSRESWFSITSDKRIVARFNSQGYSGISNSAISLNSWQLVSVTWDGKKVKYFINGSLDKEESYSGIISNSAYNLFLGSNNTNTYHFEGSLDEVRIYNRALQPSEVRQLYEYAPGPVAYYNFNEGVGSSAYDTSGNGNNGLLGAGSSAPTWTTGKFGKAMKFDNNDDFVNMGNPSLLNDVSVKTIESWVYPKSDGGGSFGRLGRIFDKGQIYLYLDSNVATFGQKFSGGEGSWSTADNLSIPFNKWSHIVVVYDRTSGINDPAVYVNGNKVAINEGSVPGSNTPISDVGDSLFIGNRLDNQRPFDGLIDEVKIYDYARTQKQIVEDMNGGHPVGGSPVSSILAWYKFDEGVGTTANNSGFGGKSLNGLLGAGISAPSWSNDGKFGKALSFDGNDFVNTNSGLLNGLNSFTVSMWANYQSSIGVWGQGNGTNSSFMETTRIYLRKSSDFSQTITNPFDTNIWTHVVITYGNGQVALYKNGKLNQGPWTTADETITNATGNNFLIGKVPSGSGAISTHFTGKIDEVKVYNYALTADEIKIDYNRGSALVLGSESTGTGNTASSNAASQEYCVPGDTAVCTAPVGRWDFNEGVGTSSYDTSGNGNHGVLGAGNSAPIWKTGKVGKGLKFDGVDDSLLCPLVTSKIQDVTLEAWVYSKLASQNAIVIYNGNTGSNGYGLYIGNGSGGAGDKILVLLGGRAYDAVSSSTVLPTNQWIYLSVTRDSSVWKLYVNGQLKHVGSTVANTPTNSTSIGSNYLGGNNFNGFIDGAIIYSYARTPAQIALDYNNGRPTAWYKMDECQGTTLNSTSETLNSTLNLTLNIGATAPQTVAGSCSMGIGSTASWGVGSTGRLNSSISLDGQDDYAIGSTTPIIAGAGQSAPSLSWGAWIKPSTSVASKTIINKNNEFKLETDSNSKASCSIYVNGSWQTAAVSSSSSPLSLWSHIICTYDGANIKVYINGLLSGTQATTGSILSLSTTALSIGRDPTPSQYFNGLIDEVKVWNYPLIGTQIKTDFNLGGIRFN